MSMSNEEVDTALSDVIESNFELLHAAVSKNDFETAKSILEGVINVNWLNQITSPLFVPSNDNGGNTLLHIAVTQGYLKIVDLLLEHHADANATDSYSWTPLHIATNKQNADIVEKLLKKNANINAVDKCGYTPLHLVDNIRIVKLLLQHNSNGNARTETGQTPLHTCVNAIRTNPNKTIRIIEVLLENDIDINAVDNYGKTPLAIACERGVYDVIKLLLVRGADVNITDSQEKSPLLITCFSGNDDKLPIVTALLEYGADVNCKDVHGSTALYMASNQGSSEIFKWLLKHGADINTKFLKYKNPLEYVQTLLLSSCDILNTYLSRDHVSEIERRHFHMLLQTFNRHLRVYEIARDHMTKLSCAGLVNFNNFDLCDKNRNFRRIIDILINQNMHNGMANLHQLRVECNEEIENLRLERIGQITLYNLLKDSIQSISNYVENEHVLYTLQLNNFNKRFPLYANIIRNRFTKAVKMKQQKSENISFFSRIGRFYRSMIKFIKFNSKTYTSNGRN